MILIDILAFVGCTYVLWRAQVNTVYNRRQLRAIKETKYLRNKRRGK
jgi:hypothetical protein